MPNQSTIIKGIAVSYSDSGKGTAVVCLHGFLETKSMWNPLLSALPKKYRIICIDLLGHGDTECLGYVHSMKTMSEIVFEVLKKLRLRSCFLIGHSMGGYVALEMLHEQPKKIKGVLLLNSTPMKDSEQKKTQRSRAIKAVKLSPKTFMGTAIENLFAPQNITSCKKHIQEILLNAKNNPVQGIIAALEGMKVRENRLKTLKNCNHALVVLGQEDPVLNYESLREILKKNSISFRSIPDGHMSLFEQPKLCIGIIKDFLKGLPTLSR